MPNHARGDAEKSPLLKGLHHGSTKRDGSSPRLGVPVGWRLGPQKIRGKIVFFSLFFREINWGVCSLPDTICLFEQKMCIYVYEIYIYIYIYSIDMYKCLYIHFSYFKITQLAGCIFKKKQNNTTFQVPEFVSVIFSVQRDFPLPRWVHAHEN